jgi:hypothetical protein
MSKEDIIMGKQAPTAITLDASVVTEYLEILELVDAEIVSFNGTWAEKVKAADAEVDAYTLDLDASNSVVRSLVMSTTVAEWASELDALVAATAEYRTAAAKEILTSSGGGAKLDALVEKRKAISSGIEQVGAVLVQFGVLSEAPSIPAAPSGVKSGAKASGRGVKVSGAQYYTIIGGKERAPSDSQNSISSIAFYRGADLLDMLDENDGKHNVPASQLMQAIENAGQDPKASTPWQVDLPGGKIGMRVNEA